MQRRHRPTSLHLWASPHCHDKAGACWCYLFLSTHPYIHPHPPTCIHPHPHTHTHTPAQQGPLVAYEGAVAAAGVGRIEDRSFTAPTASSKVHAAPPLFYRVLPFISACTRTVRWLSLPLYSLTHVYSRAFSNILARTHTSAVYCAVRDGVLHPHAAAGSAAECCSLGGGGGGGTLSIAEAWRGK